MPLKTVLITGCSDDGIGHGLATTFHQQNYHVFATTRNPHTMSKLKPLPNVTLLTLDVTNQDQINAAVAAVQSHTGGTLDILVNNAGRNHFMPVLDEDLEQTRELYEINVWGPVRVTKAFVPLLVRGRGAVVFVTSIAGYVNVPFMGTYSGSKRALELMADSLRLELTPFNVKVLCIVTGAVRTMGQTYFGDFKLPEDSLYKPIEAKIAAQARGEDGVERMDLMEYSRSVVAQIVNGETGRFWYGNTAERVRDGISAVRNPVMDDALIRTTGLDML
ncbi:SDR family oxidoreductase [Aspergillus ibericus CBS 121593]|uniref:1-acyl dihydroxyacetone phosphate reductase n=1 Tax=Aspergillus ibericus CBS 121593 TaxID=1448316 RepID=A0A395GZ05_9EURO|nr:1-acyl dihydroxyacetone phosphate reductase [Aspergillus ibericus CBS 121593]RAL00852.1 1-acyl dihydroxyacetone phosphate reductase [Aspergillus ibericus CBS 121593]